MRTTFFVSLLAGLGVVCTGHSTHAHPSREAEPGSLPSAYPDRIAVTWKNDPAVSFSVTWRTDTLVESGAAEIAVALAEPRFDLNAQKFESEVTPLEAEGEEDENVKAHYHSVTFHNLLPDTLYAYRVGGGEHWSEWFHVRTASRNRKPFSFIYFGDAQNGIRSHWSRNIRAAFTRAPEDTRFIIHAGDLVNRAHRNVEWGEWFVAGGWIHGVLPIIAVPGNHEYDEKLSVHWRPQFEYADAGLPGLEETVYYVDYQGVRIVALNSNTKIEEQAIWLRKVLQYNPNPWTVVTHHHPIYASAEGRDNEHLRTHWKPVYDEFRVDLVLQGHDHTYARGQDVRPANLGQGLNVRDPFTGTVYVNSVSGAKMYDVDEDRWAKYGAEMVRAAENTQLYQIVHVEGDKLEYRAYTVTDELYDAFDLIKDGNRKRNQLVNRIPDAAERTHENTMRYKR